MDISKKSGKVYLKNLNKREVVGFLKLNVKLWLTFIDNNNIVNDSKTIELGSRIVSEGVQKISTKRADKKDYVEDYSEVLTSISLNQSDVYRLVVVLRVSDFKDKEPLISLLDSLKEEIINSCVFIDHVKGVYSIVNKTIPGIGPDSLYYFEDDNSLLAFGKNGPVSIINNNRISTAEDIFC